MTTVTYLNVPYPQKDEAKALGARWDPLRRQWFVTSDDLSAFQRWLPQAVAAPQAEYQVTPEHHDTSTTQGIGLHTLLERVQGLVSSHFQETLWVRVEVQSLRVNQGNHYLELTEHDEHGRLLARADASIWKSQSHILRDFVGATGVELHEGVRLLVAVLPSFSPRYGLKLDIVRIDPAFTLGDMAARLRQIRDTLRQEGIYEQNRRLPLPVDYFRVAVISPKEAASLRDFRSEAARLQKQDICQFYYFDCVFQGEMAGAAIGNALQQALQLHTQQPLDAVVIIRGGGSVSDLFWLNDLELARRICTLPIPVITGIGHEPDHTLLDEVACRKCDTPSKVAQLLLLSIGQQCQRAEDALHDITHISRQLLTTQQQVLHATYQNVQNIGRQRLTTAEHAPLRLWQQISQPAQRLLTQADADYRHQWLLQQQTAHGWLRNQSANLQRQQQQCLNDSKRLLEQAEQHSRALLTESQQHAERSLQQAQTHSESLWRQILALGPQRTLQRGYGLLRQGTRPITRQADLPAGSEFSIDMHDGPIRARRAEDDHP